MALLRVLGGWPGRSAAGAAGRWTRPGTRRWRPVPQRADRGRGPAHPPPAGVERERPPGRVEVCGQQAPAGLGHPVHLAERCLPLGRVAGLERDRDRDARHIGEVAQSERQPRRPLPPRLTASNGGRRHPAPIIIRGTPIAAMIANGSAGSISRALGRIAGSRQAVPVPRGGAGCPCQDSPPGVGVFTSVGSLAGTPGFRWFPGRCAGWGAGSTMAGAAERGRR
jgi:hypothetical protein